MPNWRDLAERVDATVVKTFDYGDVTFQKMNGNAAVGAPVALPAEFEGAFVSIDTGDGTQASTVGPALTIHYADLGDAQVAVGDRFILGSGRAAGTYVVDDVQPNDDRTGALVKLKRRTKP